MLRVYTVIPILLGPKRIFYFHLKLFSWLLDECEVRIMVNKIWELRLADNYLICDYDANSVVTSGSTRTLQCISIQEERVPAKCHAHMENEQCQCHRVHRMYYSEQHARASRPHTSIHEPINQQPEQTRHESNSNQKLSYAACLATVWVDRYFAIFTFQILRMNRDSWSVRNNWTRTRTVAERIENFRIH